MSWPLTGRMCFDSSRQAEHQQRNDGHFVVSGVEGKEPHLTRPK